MNNVPTQCQQDRINMIETTAREKLFTPLYDRLQSVCVCGKLFLLKKQNKEKKWTHKVTGHSRTQFISFQV